MKTEYEKCMAGEPFIGGKDPRIVEMILRARRLLARLDATDYADAERRQALLCELLGGMGRGVHVDVGFRCECGKHIFIGDRVIVNMNCTFVDNNRIDIGSDVLIAPNVQIYTATHSTRVGERMARPWAEGGEICRTVALPVRVEDGAWIGGGSILLPGVTVGRNSVVGAGSVVTRSIPANCVAVGNPCRVIKEIDNGTDDNQICGKLSIYKYLNSLGIDYEVTEHPAVFSMEELSGMHLPYPGAVAKNLFVCDDKKSNYYLITVKGDKRVDLKAFRRAYDTRPLSLAKEEDLKTVLGLAPGAVTPLGILNDKEHKTRFFLDEDFLTPPSVIGVHPNENTAIVWLKAEDLLRIITEHRNPVKIVPFH